MKRIIIILLVIVLVIVGALVAIPVFFKQNLLDYAKRTLNKELNANRITSYNVCYTKLLRLRHRYFPVRTKYRLPQSVQKDLWS